MDKQAVNTYNLAIGYLGICVPVSLTSFFLSLFVVRKWLHSISQALQSFGSFLGLLGKLLPHFSPPDEQPICAKHQNFVVSKMHTHIVPKN